MSGRVKKAAAPKKKANGYKMPDPIAPGEIIHDTISKKKWRFGPSIGVGGFGEIYSACDHESSPKKGSLFPYVIKIEPHENGPLFVEKHFYIRNANKDDIASYMKSKKLPSLGMPTYFGNGSHEYKGEKYRYLVLERYGKDLWTIFKDNGRVFPTAAVFQIGLQMLDVLEYIHSKGYVHADLKGANILLGLKKGTENQTYLVDFGLATRVNEKEFKPDPKCAHNGTIEYTSRDAHLGVPTMRGDIEILGYNMLQWITGELPWEKSLKAPKTVQDMKETFMKNVRNNISKQAPDALIKFFEYINTLKPKEVPNFTKCRQIFESYLKTEGKTKSSKLDFTVTKKPTNKKAKADSSNNDIDDKKPSKIKSKDNIDGPKVKRARKAKTKTDTPPDSDTENEEPDSTTTEKNVVTRRGLRKSIDPAVIVKVKKTKTNPKATPPVKKNHANIATQTSAEKRKRSPRQVSFDSPICEIIGDKKPLRASRDLSVNSSGDIFDDSFVIEENKVKRRKRLVTEEEVIVKQVVKKKVTGRGKVKSWRDCATIVNGHSPPKSSSKS